MKTMNYDSMPLHQKLDGVDSFISTETPHLKVNSKLFRLPK